MSAVAALSLGSHPLWVAAVVTVLFASLARALRGVSLSGAVAGAIVCFVLYSAAGPGAFFLLALLFILTWGATRLGYQRKLKLGTAERKEGRTASQVFANVGIAAICAAAYRWSGNKACLLAMCAALAEAAADTVSSEVGQTYGVDVRLVTNWRRVPPGTNGGITVVGTVSGISAALLISLAGVLIGIIQSSSLLASFVAGSAGMICDSYLGALLEARGLLNNNSVNFLGTATAVLLVAILQFAI